MNHMYLAHWPVGVAVGDSVTIPTIEEAFAYGFWHPGAGRAATLEEVAADWHRVRNARRGMPPDWYVRFCQLTTVPAQPAPLSAEPSIADAPVDTRNRAERRAEKQARK